MTSPLYDRGYADALAGRDQDYHLHFQPLYRQGYKIGLLARENRAECMRRLIREAA